MNFYPTDDITTISVPNGGNTFVVNEGVVSLYGYIPEEEDGDDDGIFRVSFPNKTLKSHCQ